MRRATWIGLLALLAALPGAAQRTGGSAGVASSFIVLSGTGGACTNGQVGFNGGTYYGCIGSVWVAFSASGSVAWTSLTGGTNTTAAMVVGTGASLAASGTGTIAATSVPAAGLGAGTLSNATSGNAGTATACATTDGCWPKNGAYGTPTSLVLTNASGLPATALPALTGDVTTTAGSAATTVVKVNGASVPTSTLALGSNSSGQLTSFSPAWACSNPGLGDGLNAIPAGTYLQTNCYNGTGHTVTITGILCFSDNAGTSTMNVTNGAGTALLTGAVTCSASFAAGTQSATTTIASGDYAKFTFISDGSTKQTSWVIKGTY